MGCSTHAGFVDSARHYRLAIKSGTFERSARSAFCGSHLRFKNTSKVISSYGKEHPSRSDVRLEVMMFVPIITESANQLPSRHACLMGSARVLGGILFFILLHHAVPALGGTVPAGQSVSLTWDASPDIKVAGYDIYYGGASGDYTNRINVGDMTTTTIAGLTAGVTYYFAATAYDGLGLESGYSAEVSYLVPAELPAVQIRTALAGSFIVTVTGPAGLTCDIQASPDLVAWTVIGTVTLDASGSLDFTDTNAVNFPQRFYRTEQKP
jgi:hypothetical protein